MIDIEKAKLEFMNYVKNYDQENKMIVLKISHAFRVMEQSKNIAESLKLEKEQVDLATLIGLLHDIARFEQMKRYGTYEDKKSIDHGDLGAEMLSNLSFIRRFVSDDKYDNIIIFAVKNHNKYEIQDGLTDLELLHSKIIRDADKIDILYEATESFWYKESEKDFIDSSEFVSDEYFAQIKNHKQVVRKKGDVSRIDKIASYMGFIFDFNFEYTFKRTKKERYIDKIIDRFEFKNSESKKQIEEIKDIVNNFILDNISQNQLKSSI